MACKSPLRNISKKSKLPDCSLGFGVALGNGEVLSAYHVVKDMELIYINDIKEKVIDFNEDTNLVLISFGHSDGSLPLVNLGRLTEKRDLVLAVGDSDKASIGFTLGHIGWTDWHKECQSEKCSFPKDWEKRPMNGFLVISSAFVIPGFSGGGQYNSLGSLTGIHEGLKGGLSFDISDSDIEIFLFKNGITLARF